MDIVDSFNTISNTIQIPPDIKNRALINSNSLINEPYDKETMLDALQYSIKIKPLSYVDEQRFYTCVDAAYKVYEQLRALKKPKSKIFSWCLANIAMFNWFFKSLSGQVLTGREVERVVDYALRAPYSFMITNCLKGILQAITIEVSGYALSYSTGIDILQYQAIGFYIISIIINLIKVSLKIRSGEISELRELKPTA